MDRCLRVNSPRQLYKPYFGSTQRPSSPGLLATNGVEQIGDTVSLTKRGIELPRESDMAVRMIDVAPADREWDRRRVILSGIINRYHWSGFLQVEGEIDTTCCCLRYTLHPEPRDLRSHLESKTG